MREFYKHYDAIYADKDYAGEIAAISPLIGNAQRILDVGCGTGEHARHLSKAGKWVVGIDLEPFAIKKAKSKGIKSGVFWAGDVSSAPFRDFDAAISLFNVVNYLMEPADLAAFMRGIAERIQPGAPFIFECWNSVAVLNDPPKIVDEPTRKVNPILDPVRRRVHVDCAVTIYEGHGDTIHYSYDHKLWTIGELNEALTAAGFVNVVVTPRMRPDLYATPNEWKIMFICKKGEKS